jgi:hypothetical protein
MFVLPALTVNMRLLMDVSIVMKVVLLVMQMDVLLEKQIISYQEYLLCIAEILVLHVPLSISVQHVLRIISH